MALVRELMMNRSTEHPHVVICSATMGEEPMIRGTQTSVRSIVELWQRGTPPEEIPKYLPQLTLAMVFDALSYYHDTQTEVNGETLFDSSSVSSYKQLTDHFPLYSKVRTLMSISDGLSNGALMRMRNSAFASRGTREDPQDWADPDVWIPERLSGYDAEVAKHIWQESDYTINPRYIRGILSFINAHGLMAPGPEGTYKITESGHSFLNGCKTTTEGIDEAEGIPHLLAIIASHPRSKSGEIMPEWRRLLRECSNLEKESTAREALSKRLANLKERGLVAKDGRAYSITERGTQYLAQFRFADATSSSRVDRAIYRDVAQPQPSGIKSVSLEDLPEDERSIVGTLSAQPKLVDDVIQECNLPTSQVVGLLTILEMKGLVKRVPGNAYVRML